MVRLALLELLLAALVMAAPVGWAAESHAASMDSAQHVGPAVSPPVLPVSLRANESGSVEASVEMTHGSEPIRVALEGGSETERSAPLDEPTAAALSIGKADAARAAFGIAIFLALLAAFKSGIAGGLLAPLFSRIEGDRLLDHDVRRRIHEAVLASPGITIKQITAIAGIGWGTAVHHLQRLERGRLLVSQRHRQYRRFYDARAGIQQDVRDASAELIHPTSERIASEIAQHPGRAQNAVAHAVGISPALAHKYLGRLEGAQLLTRERDLKSVRYFPTTRLIEMLATSPSSPLVAA